MTQILRIRARCPAVSPSPVQLEGCTAETTFAEFQSIVLRALGVEPSDGHEHQPTILAGFPPRPLDLSRESSIGSALSDNENVTVRLASQSVGGANPAGGKWGRTKRATATATAPTRASARSNASINYAAGVDIGSGSPAAARSSKGKNSKKPQVGTKSGVSKTKGPASNGTKGGAGGSSAKTGGGGVHTLDGPLTPSPSRSSASGHAGGDTGVSPPGQVRTLFGSGAGGVNGAASNSLASGAGSSSAGKSDEISKKRSRAGRNLGLSSEGDIAERLLQAVGGGGGGMADRFFRKAMKLAVDKQYDQSRADARVRAALGGWYRTEGSATQRRLGDGESVALKVTFSKGLGAKSEFEETVDRIPREQVSAVVRMIAREPESREMLKPHNFAGCSPRMFWSLVEYWGGEVPRALRLAAPDVDWSFLETRDRKPSEKAVANAQAEEEERREKERAKEAKMKEREKKRRKKEGLPLDEPEEPPNAPGDERATEADHSTEDVQGGSKLASAVADTSADARQRAANAALGRLMASQHRSPHQEAATGNTGKSGTIGPSAEGAEGEATSITASASYDVAARSDGADGKKEEEEEVDLEGLTVLAGEAGAKLLVAAGVRTLGQLADRDEEELTRDLLIQEGRAPVEVERGDGGGSEGVVGVEQVAEWVQAARAEELDEIMADIVGGDEDIIEALEDVAVSTPRDLVRLGAFPDVFVEAVRDRVGAERWTPLEGRVTCAAVDTWRRKGDVLLEQRPWLELWVHEG